MASENIEVKTPRGKVSPEWTYFGYKIDGTTGKVTAGSGAGSKTTCKLCKTEISSCANIKLWRYYQPLEPFTSN